jgi:hypothetical protein
MARNLNPKSEYEPAVELESDEEEEVDDEASFEQPFCPRCGWHNTRPSHTLNAVDVLVRVLGMRPYRCRSCGNRFRVMRRVRKS